MSDTEFLLPPPPPQRFDAPTPSAPPAPSTFGDSENVKTVEKNPVFDYSKMIMVLVAIILIFIGMRLLYGQAQQKKKSEKSMLGAGAFFYASGLLMFMVSVFGGKNMKMDIERKQWRFWVVVVLYLGLAAMWSYATINRAFKYAESAKTGKEFNATLETILSIVSLVLFSFFASHGHRDHYRTISTENAGPLDGVFIDWKKFLFIAPGVATIALGELLHLPKNRKDGVTDTFPLYPIGWIVLGLGISFLGLTRQYMPLSASSK